MDTLTEILARLRDPAPRYQSVRLVARSWWHNPRQRVALWRAQEAARDSGAQMFIMGWVAKEAPPEEQVTTTLLWLDGARMREERASSLLVHDGVRGRAQIPGIGTVEERDTSAPDAPSGPHTPLSWMLAPLPTLEALAWQTAGEERLRGRRALRLRADADPGLPPYPHGVVQLTLGSGADHYTLWVDLERAVILRSEATLDGEPFHVEELVELTFDEALPHELFELTLAPGERVLSAEEAFPPSQPMTRRAAAKALPFALVAPPRSPRGLSESVHVHPARGERGPSVQLTYKNRRGSTIIMSESPARPEPSDGAGWEQVDGLKVLGPEPGAPVALVFVETERAGTRVTIQSADFGRAELLELARALRVVPK